MDNEKRLIDVDAFRDYWNKNYRHQYANDTFLFALANFPTVDAVEVVHGRWMSTEEKPHLIYKCSECGDVWHYGAIIQMKYCPNCGAKMDGDGNG